MILDEILGSCHFEGNNLVVQNKEHIRPIYRFLREAVLDGHIPVRKIIGYTTKYTMPTHNPSGGKHGRDIPVIRCNRELEMTDELAVTKDMAICENNFDLNERLQHIILKPFTGKNYFTYQGMLQAQEENYAMLITCVENPGPVPMSEIQWPRFHNHVKNTYDYYPNGVGQDRPEDCKPHYLSEKWVMDSKDYAPWFTFTGCSPEFMAYFWIAESTGYKSAHETVKMLPERYTVNKGEITRNWFPFDQQFNLNEFLLIPPLRMDAQSIPFRFKHNMTPEIFIERLTNWKNAFTNGQDILEEDEIKWLKQFN